MGFALMGSGAGALQVAAAGNFSHIVGNGVVGNIPAASVGENFAQFFAPFAMQLSNLSVQGPVTAPFTLNMRRSGANATLTVSDTALTDNTHVDAYAVNQAMLLQWGTGTTGGCQRVQVLLSTTAQQHGAIYAATQGSSGAGMSGGSTIYPRVAGSTPGGNTVESLAQAQAGCAGTLTMFALNIPINTTTAPSTFVSRINGLTGNQSITVAAGTAVNTRDSTHSDHLNVGDLFCAQAVIGGSGSLNVSAIGYGFTPDVGNQNDVFSIIGSNSPNGQNYNCIYGGNLAAGGTIAQWQIQPGFAGRITRFCVNVTQNTSTSVAQINLNINGTNVPPGGIGPPVGATGWFVSSGGFSNFAATDLLCWAVNGGVGAGVQFGFCGMTFQTPATYTPSITETGTALDTPNGVIARLSPMTESGTVAETIDRISVLPSGVTESGAAVETLGTVMVRPTTIGEVGSAVDTVQRLAVLVTPISETGSAVDSTNGFTLIGQAVAETGAAAETIDIGGFLTGEVDESGAAVDHVGIVNTVVFVISESTGPPVDHVDARFAPALGVVAESGDAEDVYDGPTTVAVEVAELDSASAAETADIFPVIPVTVAESADAEDAVDGFYVLFGEVDEAASAADQVDAIETFWNVIAEQGDAEDQTDGVTASFGVAIQEFGDAEDAPDTIVGVLEMIFEGASALDFTDTVAQMSVEVDEAGSAQDYPDTYSLTFLGIIEQGDAEDLYDSAAIMGAEVDEAASAAELVDALFAYLGASIQEVGAALDSPDAVPAGSVLVIAESGAAVVQQDALAALLGVSIAEIGDAEDAVEPQAALHAVIVEAGNAVDMPFALVGYKEYAQVLMASARVSRGPAS